MAHATNLLICFLKGFGTVLERATGKLILVRLTQQFSLGPSGCRSISILTNMCSCTCKSRIVHVSAYCLEIYG